jgi:hypothetical protein
MLGNSYVAAELVAPQEGPSSISEWVRFLDSHATFLLFAPPPGATVHDEPWPLLWLHSIGHDPVTYISNL